MSHSHSVDMKVGVTSAVRFSFVNGPGSLSLGDGKDDRILVYTSVVRVKTR